MPREKDSHAREGENLAKRIAEKLESDYKAAVELYLRASVEAIDRFGEPWNARETAAYRQGYADALRAAAWYAADVVRGKG